MQLSDDGSADEAEQTPATLQALLGADATGRRMSPQVQRLLSANRGKLGAIGAQRTLVDEMETSEDGALPGGSNIPSDRDHGSADTLDIRTRYVQSAVEDIEQQTTMQKMREQEQLIQRLMQKLEETQVAVGQLQNSPGRMAADEDVSFKMATGSASTTAMQEQMRAQQELIQMLAVNMAESTRLQRESVELSKQQYAGSKVRKDTDKSFDTL